MPNEMGLYHSAASPNSRRSDLLDREKPGDPSCACRSCQGRATSDAYCAINPRRVVPTLVLEDDTAIGEVPAICRYIEETHPTPALLGETAKEKALVTMWERRAELEGFAGVMEAVRNAAPGLKSPAIAGPHDYEQIPELAGRSKLRVQNLFGDFDARLGEAPFVAGRRFSVADITALVTVDFAAKAINFSVPDEHRSLKRWYDAISRRPSMAA
jgi:glutathione S-transferase